jgi:hypothetical protein
MQNAVEEFLRYDSPVQLTGRVAMESTLLRRIPNLRIHDVVNPDWRPTFVRSAAALYSHQS